MRFGIIGTNFIVDSFIEAGKLIEEFEITAIYSRNRETGESFAEKHGIKNIFTDMDKMIESGVIDAVYIASPNYIHMEQCIKFLERKIPVLCEKPLASNEREVRKMFEIAEKNGVFLMEAMRTIYNPKYSEIEKAIAKIGAVRGVTANFCQYSSRYDKFKEGIVLNAFKNELSNGSLMDIGAYAVNFVFGLFGKPDDIEAQGYILHTGVDGSGDVLMKYPEFSAVVGHSKICNSYMPSEIRGERGSIIIEKISLLEKVEIRYRDGRVETIEDNKISHDMYYEIKYFMENCHKKIASEFKKIRESSIGVIEILDESRKQIGIKYPADEN